MEKKWKEIKKGKREWRRKKRDEEGKGRLEMDV